MVNPRIYSAPAMLPEIHRAPTCAVPQWQLRSKLPPEASDHCAGQRLPWKKMVGSPTTIGLCRDVMGIYWDIMEYNNSWDVTYIGELKIAMENGPFIDKSSIKNYWSSSHVSLLESTNTHTQIPAIWWSTLRQSNLKTWGPGWTKARQGAWHENTTMLRWQHADGVPRGIEPPPKCPKWDGTS